MRPTNAHDYRIPALAKARRSTMINHPYSVGTVADAEVLAEIQTHPRHWRIFRRHAIGGAS